jgi:adenylate kinase
MTWAKTKIDAEDSEASLSEEDYRKRRAHPNFKTHLELEKEVIKNGKKGPLKTYVVAAGLVYHGGDNIFHHFLKVTAIKLVNLECLARRTRVVMLRRRE